MKPLKQYKRNVNQLEAISGRIGQIKDAKGLRKQFVVSEAPGLIDYPELD